MHRYGNVMLSRVKFHGCAGKDLESQMGRRLMLGATRAI